MSVEEIKKILHNEKINLYKAMEYVLSFYTQVHSSIINIRDNLFTSAFTSNQTWKSELSNGNASLSFPEYTLQSVEGEIQNNSESIIVVLNNIQVIQNSLLKTPDKLTIQDIQNIQKANDYTLNFIQRLYSRDNMALIADQRLKLAKAVRNNVVKIFENSITPYIDKVESILVDEYKINIRPILRRIIGAHTNYGGDPFKFDLLIKEKCSTTSIQYHQDIILAAIADLAKSDDALVKELKARYITPETQLQAGKIYKLKEIASRSIAQVSSLAKLEGFLVTVHNLYQPLTLFQRIVTFLKKIITGKEMNFPKKDLYFFYSSRTGRLEKRQTSIKILIKDINSLKVFLAKVKETVDFYSYTKTSNLSSVKDMENVIDNSISAMNTIYTQCLGLRDWLVWKKNISRLDKIPLNQQEEFNELLLAINYHLIISKQQLRDMMKKH
ncbi:MAG: hypothetical protein JXJ04_09625 [Spirochaetales bacterium]|nr:hypothetical protein [Spirochaetales bacterium]